MSFPEEESLEDEIMKKYAIAVFDNATQDFLPNSCIAELITEDSIRRELKIDQNLENSDEKDLIYFILHHAKKVFAIALVSGVGGDDLFTAMKKFKQSNFRDDNNSLPVKKKALSALPCFSGRPWKLRTTRSFFENQWRFLAPVFSSKIFKHDLEPEHILPFVWVGNEFRDGTFSQVYKVLIHEAHQENPFFTVDGRRAHVAIKEIKDIKDTTETGTSDALLQEKANKEFNAEAKALYELSSLNHPNIIQPIAAITSGRKRYFMFQWADGGSLRDFWDTFPHPSLYPGFTKEIVQQLRGLADALNELHNYKGAWRHGDLKPENILRFRNNTQVGNLQLADLGLAKHHSAATHLRQRTSTRYGTMRYEPPEVTTHKLVDEGRSRLYDIWSMGCITLELIVWLLYGTTELRKFNASIVGSFREVSPYFEIENANDTQTATVHSSVRAYMDRILRDSGYPGTTAIRDLLEIVRTRLLVVSLPQRRESLFNGDGNLAVDFVNATDDPFRATAKEFRDLLDEIIGKGEQDKHYWVASII